MIIRNFLFHRVHPEHDALWPPMHPTLFEKIIVHLKKNYELITLENWAEQKNTFKSNKKIATIGFDDGFKDNLEYAAPILQKHKVPASFYVVSNCINQNIPTWTYQLDYSFQHTKKLNWNCPENVLPSTLMISKWDSKNEQLNYAAKLKAQMKNLPNVSRLLVLERIKNSFIDVELPKLMMNWQDVNQLIQAGFEIGSHTHTHPILSSLSSEGDIRQELEVSKTCIERQTGKQCKTLSYPNGKFDQRVIDQAIKTGYTIGLATGQTFFNTSASNHFSIPRTELYQENFLKTTLRISGVLEKVKNIIRK